MTDERYCWHILVSSDTPITCYDSARSAWVAAEEKYAREDWRIVKVPTEECRRIKDDVAGLRLRVQMAVKRALQSDDWDSEINGLAEAAAAAGLTEEEIDQLEDVVMNEMLEQTGWRVNPVRVANLAPLAMPQRP